MHPETREAIAPDGLRILAFPAMGTTISVLAPDETAEAAQKRFADEITVAKKQRDAAIAKAEKSFRAESEKATQKYLSTAEKSASKYADSLRTAIAATIAAYAGKLNESGPPAFTTAADDAHWSACDDVAEVKKFIAERAHLADHAAKPPEVPWSDGIGRFNQVVPDSGAQPIWGQQRNTWIKFVAE